MLKLWVCSTHLEGTVTGYQSSVAKKPALLVTTGLCLEVEHHKLTEGTQINWFPPRQSHLLILRRGAKVLNSHCKIRGKYVMMERKKILTNISFGFEISLFTKHVSVNIVM